jgi:hypothetical protein
MKKSDSCLFPDCPRPVNCRGLCHTHYSTVAQMVHRKKTTWAQLEADGKVTKPTGQRGRPPHVREYFSK